MCAAVSKYSRFLRAKMEVNGDVGLSVKSTIVEKRGVDLKEKKHRLTHMAPILWFMRFLWFFNVDCGKGIKCLWTMQTYSF